MAAGCLGWLGRAAARAPKELDPCASSSAAKATPFRRARVVLNVLRVEPSSSGAMPTPSRRHEEQLLQHHQTHQLPPPPLHWVPADSASQQRQCVLREDTPEALTDGRCKHLVLACSSNCSRR